ncbi:MAG: preprotein translocase subunit SecG [Dissulfurispiraceae bacterium]
MVTVLIILHVVVCIFLISIVLLQRGKGADIGAAFGGSSQTLFGSRGAATFLNKLTTASAVIFMLTSLALTMATTKTTSVIKQTPTEDQRKALPQQLPQQPVQQVPQQPAQQVPQQLPQQPMNK